MTDQTQDLLTDRLRKAREDSRARQLAIARLPTLGISIVMAVGSVLSAILIFKGADYSTAVPLMLGAAAMCTWFASRWVEQAPEAAGQAGIGLTLLATLALTPVAHSAVAVPIGAVALALVVVGGTLSARPGSWIWIPLSTLSWWLILYLHPPALVDLVPAAVFPPLLLGATGVLVGKVMTGVQEHDALSRDALAALAEVGSELELQRRRALAANRAKSAFLTNMSHELRTPLNAIIGYSELILEDIDDVDPQDVESIASAGKNLLVLVNDVLHMSRLEAEGTGDTEGEVVVRPLLEELHQLATGLTETRGLRLTWTVDPEVPESVPGEGLQVRQVLMNLLGNAVKFTEAGEIRLHATREGDRLVTRVTDTGPGIPAKLVDQVFDPFAQGESQGMKHAGSGLGLAIARELARAMRGDILVESEVGVGTTFSFVLPLH